MPITNADAAVVAALAAVFIAWLYMRHAERQRRLDIAHKERLAAMDKGVPLPEVPIDPRNVRHPLEPRVVFLHGMVWAALAFGAMVALRLVPGLRGFWPLPLPMLLLGLGLMLYYRLVAHRAR